MLTPQQLESLKATLPPGSVYTDLAALVAYSHDAGFDRSPPDGVAVPSNASEVQLLARWSAEQGVPLTARGSGTGLTGGSVTAQGGVVVSLSRMNAILEIDELSRTATVEPGLITEALQKRLAPLGLYYPPDPASQAVSTLGGNIAENAGGPHCLKYGVTGNYVLGLQVVLPGGQLVQLGGAALDAPEYDLVAVMTGSEGTLGLITQATLQLRHPPESVKTLTASFRSVAEAGQAVSAVIAARLLPATIELMDGNMIRIVEAYLHAGLPTQAGALLIFDIEGYTESIEPQLERLQQALGVFDPIEIHISRSPAERALLWRSRRSAAGAMARISPNEISLDVSLPRSRLAEGLQAITNCAHEHGFRVAFLGHAGDGNLHPNLLCDFSIPGEIERAHRAAADILYLSAGMGGTIGGEHGIGLEKRLFLPAMYSSGEIAAMLQIKEVFDSEGLFNPGKIFPPGFQAPPQAAKSSARLADSAFSPRTSEEAAALLNSLQCMSQPTYCTGGGTHWRGQPASAGVTLNCTELNGIQHLSPNDLYVCVRAGTKLTDLQASLAEHGLWVPLASHSLQTSIGGLISVNGNNPLRVLYGSVRDQLLALQVAMPDGRLLRFGRPLVKDVAGYSMSKLFVGAYGTLGLLTEVTLKLWPLPLARRTLMFPITDLQAAITTAQLALEHSVVCAGIVITPAPGQDQVDRQVLAYTAEGHPADVEAELKLVRAALDPLSIEPAHESESRHAVDYWNNSFSMEGVTLRLGIPASRLSQLISEWSPHLAGGNYALDAATGLLQVSFPSAPPAQVNELRQAAERQGGYAVLAGGPRRLLTQQSAWGTPRSSADLMSHLKSAWDPAGILNPGEFPASRPEPGEPK